MGVSRVFERSSRGVSGKFKWCFNGILSKFLRSSSVVSRVFKKVSREFQKGFEGVSMKTKGCFKGVCSGFQG